MHSMAKLVEKSLNFPMIQYWRKIPIRTHKVTNQSHNLNPPNMHIYKIKVYEVLSIHLPLRNITFRISKPNRGLKQASSVGHLSHKLLFDFQNYRTWAQHNFSRHISYGARNSVKSIGCLLKLPRPY